MNVENMQRSLEGFRRDMADSDFGRLPLPLLDRPEEFPGETFADDESKST